MRRKKGAARVGRAVGNAAPFFPRILLGVGFPPKLTLFVIPSLNLAPVSAGVFFPTDTSEDLAAELRALAARIEAKRARLKDGKTGG